MQATRRYKKVAVHGRNPYKSTHLFHPLCIMINPIFNPLILISSVLFIHATFIPSVAAQRKENTTTIVENKSAKMFLVHLPKALEKVRAEGGIKGMSVAIVHKGELVFAQGFGKRNRNDPFTKEVN